MRPGRLYSYPEMGRTPDDTEGRSCGRVEGKQPRYVKASAASVCVGDSHERDKHKWKRRQSYLVPEEEPHAVRPPKATRRRNTRKVLVTAFLSLNFP